MGAAYATLAPSAHKLFPTKEAYMRAMLENFGALVYASDFELGDLRETSKGIAQEVRVSDRRGRPFIAFFFFERSGSDSWSIRQIIMAPLPAEAA
jgi:hypothetical protein